ncbi:MAG: 5-formyltetrahydrofolate cyclo-ligase [Bacteroidales bacterium]|jgi:5-formyltetrahydrofolate cyclo-ligase|nr:5-formyltetrahydrofolate cyclo-ligase [Bacteroidales bacterium]
MDFKKKFQDKNEIRRYISSLKRQLSETEIQRQSENVFRQVAASEIFARASVILIYWSMPDEVRTYNFIEAYCGTKTFVLPVIEGDHPALKLFDGAHRLVRNGRWHVYEPQGERFEDFRRIQLAIVPGVAFDADMHRLGRGKGYYDKLLSQAETHKIGVGFHFQLLEKIPHEPHDIAMDQIITGIPG